MALAASASATPFSREVSSEEIEWTSTSRLLSYDGGGPWTGGSIEACPAFVSTSWAIGFAALTPVSAAPTSVVPGVSASATTASVVLGTQASVASASEVRGASASVSSATEGASAPPDSRARPRGA
ncbi:uncharacterized protein [Miscanthus floridulus]|uniref:uncharacterized protein n=1 Tax=Miscanthus floridulus TaxID=154761 RepID=UPI003457C038